VEIKLYKHQEQALLLSKQVPDIGLFWEMGTGKTAGIIHILRDKYNTERKIMRTLILGPVAVTYNWMNEIRKYSKIPDSKVIVLDKKREEKFKKFAYDPIRGLNTNGGIVIANYEALLNRNLYTEIAEWEPEIIVCDESHMLKNPMSKRAKCVMNLADRAKNRFILTGTPILNSPIDIFQQYRILDGGKTLGKSFYVFRATYFRDANSAWAGKQGYFPKWIPQSEKFDDLSKKIYSKALRVLKSQCLDLPERIEKTVHVELSREQQVAYNAMKKEFVAYVKDIMASESGSNSAIVANLAMVKALRLQQIVTGCATLDDGSSLSFGKIPRLDTVRDLLEQITPSHKVILWCSFRDNYRQLGSVCDELGLKYVLITGEQDAKQKQESVEAFQDDDEVKVVIANRRAGGTGINLTAASYSIVYSKNFSLAEELQSRDRNHRGGSEIHRQIVKIDLCATNTIDETINKALADKKQLSDIIIDLAKGEGI